MVRRNLFMKITWFRDHLNGRIVVPPFQFQNQVWTGFANTILSSQITIRNSVLRKNMTGLSDFTRGRSVWNKVRYCQLYFSTKVSWENKVFLLKKCSFPIRESSNQFLCLGKFRVANFYNYWCKPARWINEFCSRLNNVHFSFEIQIFSVTYRNDFDFLKPYFLFT